MNDFTDLFASTEQSYGLPTGFLGRVAQIESSMNPRAQNPRSSAGGLFQFIDSTARQYGLQDRFDPAQATDAAARLARDNADRLRNALGRDPTAGELYLAHQQGGGGAARLLANPSARAADIVGARAVTLNGGTPDMTAGQFAQRWIGRVDGAAAPRQSAPQMLGYAATPRPSPAIAAIAQATGGQPSAPQGQAMSDTAAAEKPAPSTIGGLGGLGGFQPIAGGKFGDMLQMIGMALLSSPGNAPLQNLPALQMAMAGRRDQAEERARAQANTDREFGLRQSEAARQSSQFSQTLGLQQQQLELQRQRADLDGSNVSRDAQQRRQVAEGLGLRPGTPEFNSYVLTGAMPAAAANAPQQVAQMNAARETEAKRLGLREGTPEYQNYVLTGRFRDSPELSTTDRKAIMEAEEQVPILQGTVDSLRRALELNPQAYSGVTASALARIGTSGIPGAGTIADSGRAAATREFQNLMSEQAIQQMSTTLKGATTDREMGQFIEILGNPSTPPEIRERTIKRMLTLAERQMQLQQERVRQLRGRDYFRPGGGVQQGGAPAAASSAPAAPAPAPAPAGGPALPQVGEVRSGYRFKGGNPGDQSSWERVQ